ncbi:uncharacterized protein [Ambystoma mexicanum]|uniref:uncharacterized protein isoform X1 n=1 Tax=Ambystoma mexicanum TaxID=8296 RepID=UPI0037E6FDDC
MFRQDSDKAPVTFRDVAAYFSDDEWKLLHEWQKELYSNVMKEIHQAMVSLGPLIATSVFSLRAKEKEDLCLAELDDSERRYVPDLSQSTSTNPVALSGIHREKNLHVAKPLDSEVEERNDSLSTGFSYLNPDNGLRNGAESRADIMDHSGTGEESSTSSSRAVSTSIVSFCIKEEVEGYSKDHLDSEGSEHTSSHVGNPFLNVDFCLRKEEVPSTCLRDRLVSEGGQTTRNSSGNDDFTTVHIKREQEAYPIVLQETDREESVSSPVGINMQQQLDLPPRFVQHPNPDSRRNRHWLSVSQRASLKALSLTHKSLANQAPSFLACGLYRHTTSRPLRSAQTNCLDIPRFNLQRSGGHSFPVLAAKLWNSLPNPLKAEPSFPLFKRKGKAWLSTHDRP